MPRSRRAAPVQLVLTGESYAGVVSDLVALRALAGELESVFASFARPADRTAAAGAHAMVETIDRVLDRLGYDPERAVS